MRRVPIVCGVTGAGKTEVSLALRSTRWPVESKYWFWCQKLALHRTCGAFRARFGPDVAVLHSGLTGTERLAQWRRIRGGGPRSRWCTLCYFCTVYLWDSLWWMRSKMIRTSKMMACPTTREIWPLYLANATSVLWYSPLQHLHWKRANDTESISMFTPAPSSHVTTCTGRDDD